MKRFTLLKRAIAFFCCTALSVNAQTGISPALDSALQNSINSLKTTFQVKGISAAAYIPAQGLWQGVTGVSHGTVPIDSSMVLSMGSVTKTFVSAEIFKLVEAGQLSLDDSLYSVLPPMQFVDSSITIRQLLGHKSGLAEYLNTAHQNAMFADLYRIWYGPEVIDSFLTAPIGAPGGPFNYCNTNYILLGMVIEALRGDSLHHVLRDDFLTPLNLANTYMQVFEQYSNPVPHPWSAPNLNPSLAVDVSGTPRIALASSTEAAGGLYSTAADLARWGYNLYSGNVISSTSLNEMLTFTTVAGSYFSGYGLGSMRFPGNGRTYWGHAGNFFGFAACLLYYPQDSISVAVLINMDCNGANIAKPLMNTLINTITVGINEHWSGEGIKIYPNPASRIAHIRFDEKLNVEKKIELFDAIGRSVFQQENLNQDVDLVLNDFKEGVYILKITGTDYSHTEKIIIQR